MAVSVNDIKSNGDSPTGAFHEEAKASSHISQAWKKHKKLLAALALLAIILLGGFLRFYKLGAYSIGNAYYAATVKSMLTSWHNFFYAAFEPGGSITVDKPPLGFWVQAISASIFGVNGFALALPQALAGVLSIPLLYVMVKRQFGVWPGLAAALALAVTPVTVSTERNNTVDGLLLFVLLLAAFFFLESIRKGKFRYLLLGAFLVGLGFNIKMLQAFMPLPAFYLLYLLGAPQRWWKRILHLAAATVVLLVVSLSWAVAVDLTPAENRPYIGSSSENSVLELITGHNGIRRLVAMGRPGQDGNQGQPSPGQPGQFQANQPPSGNRPQFPPPQGTGPQGQKPPLLGAPGAGPQGQLQPPSGNRPQFPPPQGAGSQGQNLPPLGAPGGAGPQGQFQPAAGSGQQNPPSRPPGGGPGGGNPIGNEVGQASALRLFSQPLSDEASWLLPMALLGLPLVLILLGWKWPLSEKHLALVLWGGWLLPELLYFSFTSGLFHTYYLIMLGPPLAALVGATAWALGKTYQKRWWLGVLLFLLLGGITLCLQVLFLLQQPNVALGIALAAGALFAFGLLALAASPLFNPPALRLGAFRQGWLAKVAQFILLASLMVAPLTWAALTTFNENPDVGLPRSGPADQQQTLRPNMAGTLSQSQQMLLEYLLANTDLDSYLFAVLSAQEASPFIIESGRPVLTFGGFTGGDNAVSVEQLAQMVADGELRFVAGSQELSRRKAEIGAWVTENCSAVDVPSMAETGTPTQQPFPAAPGMGNQRIVLYDCGAY